MKRLQEFDDMKANAYADDVDDDRDADADADAAATLARVHGQRTYMRQTLLFSATANNNSHNGSNMVSVFEEKKLKKNKKKFKDIGEGAVRKLPFHIQE